MRRVEVRLFANLREAVGKDTIFLDFKEDPTVKMVLLGLVEREPELRAHLLANGSYNDRYKVLVGGKIVFPENYSKTISSNRVAILPPVSGG